MIWVGDQLGARPSSMVCRCAFGVDDVVGVACVRRGCTWPVEYWSPFTYKRGMVFDTAEEQVAVYQGKQNVSGFCAISSGVVVAEVVLPGTKW